MNAETIGTVIAVVGAAVGVGGPVFKWLISDWFAKSQKLEEMNRNRMNHVLIRFEGELDELKPQIRNLRQSLADHKVVLARTQSQVEMISELLDRSIKQASDISLNLDSKVKDEVRTEILNLKNQLMMIKKKSGGASGK